MNHAGSTVKNGNTRTAKDKERNIAEQFKYNGED